MKMCSRCKIEKPLTDFRKRSRAKDGLSVWCRECFAEYDRERYQNGDRARKEKNRMVFTESNRTNLWNLLSNSECANCGNTDPEVLEFDHRDPTVKEFNVSAMLYSYSWANIQKEIDKCDILCANCHRKRTIRQLNFWRGERGVV